MKVFQKPTLAIVLFVVFGSMLWAQEPSTIPKELVKVDVVLSRYDGTRRISSLPYTLLATTNSGVNASVRTGGQVAFAYAASPTSAADGKPSPNWNYLDIGTNIDCKVATTENGRFKVDITINDRSVLERQSNTLAGSTSINAPTLRSFTYSNSILLKDGESKQFLAASDKVSGDVIKIDVTLTAQK